MISIAPGTITTIAGTGDPGCSGDGGPALKACLNEPKSITVAGRGLYIADTFNHRVRRVDAATGTIWTLAGTGTARSSGDGGPATKAMLNEPVALALDEQRDLLYIADLANYRVRVVDLETGRITTYAGNGER